MDTDQRNILRERKEQSRDGKTVLVAATKNMFGAI